MAKFLNLDHELSFYVADGASSFRESLQQCLKNLGFRRIFCASDGLALFGAVRAESPGFIICERNMRGMSGAEVLKELRESVEFRRVPFMLMTDAVRRDDVVLAAEYGIDGFLRKPFSPKDLAQRITATMLRYSNKNNMEAYLEKAREVLLSGRADEALSLYQTIVKRFPVSARARTALARCQRIVGSLEEAGEGFQASIAMNPQYVHAFHELGLLHFEMGRLDDSKAAFEQAIAISPLNPIRYESIANILISGREYASAEEYLVRAVNLELSYPALHEQLGKVLFEQKKLERASQSFARALKAEPNNISFLNSIAICLKEMGRAEEALDHYNQALKQTPNDVKLLFNKVLLLVDMGRLDRARKTCESILAIDPEYEKARKKLAAIQKREGAEVA